MQTTSSRMNRSEDKLETKSAISQQAFMMPREPSLEKQDGNFAKEIFSKHTHIYTRNTTVCHNNLLPHCIYPELCLLFSSNPRLFTSVCVDDLLWWLWLQQCVYACFIMLRSMSSQMPTIPMQPHLSQDSDVAFTLIATVLLFLRFSQQI